MSKQLIVELTDDQYTRFKAALTSLQQLETEATDEQLVAQLKREASAVTYAVEVGAAPGDGWSF